MCTGGSNSFHVFTTDAGQEAGYAVIQGVRPLSAKVSVGYYGLHPRDIGRSRYVDQTIRLELPKKITNDSVSLGNRLSEAESMWCDTVYEYARAHGVSAVIPTNDAEVYALSKDLERFRAADITVPVPSFPLVNQMMDKLTAPRFVNELGLPVPKSAEVHSASAAVDFAAQSEYPLVVKERFGYFSAGVTLVKDQVALMRVVSNALTNWKSVVVQEYIPGSHEPSVMLSMSPQGKAREAYIFRKHRYIQASFSTCIETIPAIPELQKYIEAAESLQLPGIIVVQLKRDERDGRHKLMEINFRLGANSRMATRLAMRHGYNPVLSSIENAPDCPKLRVFPAGQFAVSPVEDLLALTTYARAKMHRPSEDNPTPSVKNMAQSYADTYLRSPFTVDWFASNLLQDTKCVYGSYVRNMRQLAFSAPDFIPWGEVSRRG